MESEVIGGYKILDQIGAGGMAKVYLAVHKDVPNLRVILKILSDSRLVERFTQEADKLAMLDGNPNICRIKHFFRHDESIVIAMEYIDGVTLDERIKDEGRLPVAETLRIISDVLAVLEFAHSKGIYHRDIKPSNIMIDKSGNVKVIDFGIAKAESDPNLTLAGSACGTPTYMAPEQFTPSEKTNYALVDIYGTGVTLYRTLSGKLPFVGENEFAIRDAKLFTEPPALRDVNPEIPRELDSITMKSLAKNPVDRFATASEMKVAIQSVKPVEGKAPRRTVAAETGRSGRKPKGRLIGGIIGVAVLAVAAFVVVSMLDDSPLNPPALLSPPNGAAVPESSPLLVWEGADGEGITYQLEYANNPEFFISELASDLIRNEYVVPEDLEEGEYFWRVKAHRSDRDSSEFSETFSFVVQLPQRVPVGSLIVVVSPQGDIYLDDRLLDSRSEGTTVEVDSGDHRVEVRNERAIQKSFADDFSIVSDTSISLSYSFSFPSERTQSAQTRREQQPVTTGELRIGSKPTNGATVYIDGELQSRKTPSAFKLSPGRHIIRASHIVSGVEKEIVDTVEIISGADERLVLDFES